jgi:hypothetical protein
MTDQIQIPIPAIKTTIEITCSASGGPPTPNSAGWMMFRTRPTITNGS